jgi:hypothetical protein
MKSIYLALITALLAASSAGAAEMAVDGMGYAGSSRNILAQGTNGLLAGFFTYGAAVYEFSLPQGTDRVKFQIDFDNLKGKWLKAYVYNYGTVYDDPSFRNRKISPNWKLWQATQGTGIWSSQNPEYLYTTSSDGRIDYLGPDNKLQLLLYADGGIPYLGDGRFLIKQVKLLYSNSSAVAPLIIISENSWIEGDYLLVKGIGKSKNKVDMPGFEGMAKTQALRAAKVVAYKNLGKALGKISVQGGTANLPGVKVRSTKIDMPTKEDFIAEVILELPLASLQPK